MIATIRSAAPLQVALALAATLVAGGIATADCPDDQECQNHSRQPRQEDYENAMENFIRRHWEDAIPDFEKAIEKCPVPAPKCLFRVGPVGAYPYIPFFSLGKCNFKVEDWMPALKNLSLSACSSEVADDEERWAELEEMTLSCRERVREPSRPQSFLDFATGYQAAAAGEWRKMAEKMWNSLQRWEEDGGTTFASGGRWPDPYVPHLRLATALNQLGCYREAAEEAERSRVEELRLDGLKEVRKELKTMKDDLSAQIAKGGEEPEFCRRWHCLLGHDGGRSP